MRIKYSDYKTLATDYDAYLDVLKENIGAYNTILSAVESNGVASGAIHESLVNYKTKVNAIVDLIDDLKGKVKSSIEHFLKDLDDAQKIDGENIL